MDVLKELNDIYESSVNVGYVIGSLKRAEEASENYVELQTSHIHEMVGSLSLLQEYQEDILTRLSLLIEKMEGF